MIQLIGRIVLVVCVVLCVLAFFDAPAKADPKQLLAVAGALGFGAILVLGSE